VTVEPTSSKLTFSNKEHKYGGLELIQMFRTAGKKVWRGNEQFASACSSCNLSITCRGKAISREELFA
jgi:hypothetical protein